MARSIPGRGSGLRAFQFAPPPPGLWIRACLCLFPGTFWTVEWSFSFAALAEYTDRQQSTPAANEAWFMIFAR